MSYYIQQVPRITLDLSTVRMGLVSGLLAGAITGVVARAAMRFVALYSGSAPSFSWGGTLGIVFIFAIILGLPLGLLYLAVRQYLPFNGMLNGLIFGALLFLLLILIPFFVLESVTEPSEEFANLTAGTASLLFAPVPLVFGLSIAWFVGQLELSYQAQPVRPVSLVWLAMISLATILAVVGMGSLLNSRLIFPRVFVGVYQALGLSFTTSRQLHVAGMLAYLGLYVGLCLTIFWRSAASTIGKFTAVALLLFAAAYFSTNGENLSSSARQAMADPLILAVVQAVGLAVLVLWMMLYPDGSFQPSRGRWVYYGLVIGLGLALLGELLGLAAAEALLEGLFLLGLLAGWSLLARRYRRTAGRQEQQQIRPALWGSAAAIGVYLILLAASLFEPDLLPWTFTGPDGLFAFGPYLLAWLLIPWGVLLAIRKHGLWQSHEAERE